MEVYFITGNENKAKYLEKLLGLKIKHQKVDLDEIQSMDLREIVKLKVKEAYEKIKKPVLVEDVGLFFNELNGLPGPFVKFFLEKLSLEEIANLIKADRGAEAKTVFGFYDGEEVVLFESSLKGRIAESPRGENGFGWDKIFIPDGYQITRAEMNQEDDEKTYKQIKGTDKIREFLIEKYENRN